METFIVNDENIEAEVYKQTGKEETPIYLVKLKFLDLGLYINGIRVQESLKYPDRGWWVQMPTIKVGPRFIGTVEMDKSTEFYEMVDRKTQEAVEAYRRNTSKEYLDDIPF